MWNKRNRTDNAERSATAEIGAEAGQKESRGRTYLNRFSKVWSVLYILMLAGFVGMILRLDMLPANLLYKVLTVLGALSLLIFPMLYFKNIHRSRKIVAIVLSVVLMGGYAYGMVNLNDTSSFFREVTDVGNQTEDFYLIVKKSSSYEKLKDLDGKTAGTYFTTESNYSSAKSKLAGNINITYKIIKTLSKLDDGLLKGDYESVFVSAAQYKTMCEKVSKFKSKTRIIYTIRIDVSQKDLSKKVDVTQNSFNIYVSGLDTSGNIREMSRSDVNMIVTVNPKTHVVLLTSIPRDYEIQLPSYNNATDKLTHTGIYGIRETIGAVEKLTGIDMNYYVKVNYSTVRRFVDAIGGIDVYSDYDFTTHGMAVQYTFRKGKNHLDGKKALAFARERKSFEDGDVQRNRDQAKVMSAIISKCTSSTTILARYSTILNSCKQYMEINMEAAQIKQLVKMQVNGGYKWKIRKQNVEGNSVLETCYSSGDYQVYVMKPDDDDVTNATDKIIGVMDGTVR